MRGAAKQSKWRKAGFLVRNVTTTRDVAKTGYEVLDGKGLPIKIVDQKSGDELNELLPLTGSLNLVRRTAAAQFGYTKQVVVHVAPKPPAGNGCSTEPWTQCGGKGFVGDKCCPEGYSCVFRTQDFSQCARAFG